MPDRPKRGKAKQLSPASTLTDVIDTVIQLEKRLTEQENVTEKATANLLLLETRMTEAETRLKKAEDNTVNLTQILDDLSEKVNRIGNDVGVNTGRIDSIETDTQQNSDSILNTRLVGKHPYG